MSGEQYNTDYMNSEFYSDSAYTADISTRMRVPDRCVAVGLRCLNFFSGSHFFKSNSVSEIFKFYPLAIIILII